MESEYKANLLVELHKSSMDHFNKTRDLEFKVNIALWTLIAVGGYFLNDALFQQRVYYASLIYFFAAVAFLALHVSWMYLIQKSEDIEQKRMIAYRKMTADLIENATLSDYKDLEKLHVKPDIKFKEVKKAWIILEVAITAVLLAVVGAYLFL